MLIEMKEIILKEISAKYPIVINEIEEITNEMFRCNDNENEYFVRITGYKSYEEQQEELKWINFLSKHGVGVPSVVPSIEGNLVETGNFPQEKCIVLFKAAKGIHLPRSSWNSEIFKDLGREIGKMHRITARYESQTELEYIKEWNENEEYYFLKYIPAEETIIRELAEAVLAEVQQLPRNSNTYGLLHGDIWLENVLVANQSNITIIDFQDCERHYYLYDLVVPIYSALEFSFAGKGNINDYAQSIAESLFAGYLEEHSLPLDMIEKLPLFFKLKEIFEYCLMHMYWDAESLSEEQVRILNLYRFRLENNYPSICLNYERITNIIKYSTL
ncbi:phosphotransferase enzyme family protein [Paenibacillus sp. IHBB 10380]|uniref:phosphotransferase enzyme family protein n=1 Tax=Paenibacillus sp. IHBB 10380 TaxID=1566358 RepID=UPI0005CFB449|nr:phosphotransferase [Paenibacillus sp. IHBB 10380]